MAKKETFDVIGMTCAACQAAVDRSVRKLEGVEMVDVSLLSNTMKVEYDPEKTDAAKIMNAVEEAGYKAEEQAAQSEQAAVDAGSEFERRSMKMREEMDRKKKILITSLVLLCVLLCFSMLPMLGVFTFLMDMEWMMADAVIQLFLATVILFVERDFFINGFRTLFKGHPNMDSLVAIGSSVSFVYAFYGILRMAIGYGLMDHEMIHSSMDALYFESAAMIVTLVSLGKYLEARSKTKTGDALAKLVKLAPKTAMVERNGEFVEIPVEQVKTGDKIRMVPGSTVPVDGVVISGHGVLDQSALTGESIPVDKDPGDEVMSATTNQNGSFIFQATKVGVDTTLSQIIALVDEAGNSKAPIARLADKVSGIFVPTVLTIAALTLIGWLIAGAGFAFALNCAISVLVISCPCALGLATPLAIMVSTGKAASNGILVKSASALEALASVNTVVLDKTGTITKGKPALSEIIVLDPAFNDTSLLQIAASAEAGSEHPLALAILDKAKADGLTLSPVEDFYAFGGRGLRAAVNGQQILAGNLAFMNEQGIPVSEHAKNEADRAAHQGGTPLYFASNRKLIGLICVADEIRETSRQAIAGLRQEGIQVIMLTGDNERTAKAVASSLDLDGVIADVLPANKEAVIRDLQEKGRNVAMVGDGINDAPALMRANVGIAIGAGTDIAIDAADIVLMKDNLLDALTAIDLSKSTMRNIRENLFWAFFYNVLGIPVAMGLFYPAFGWLLNPMIGAAAMSFSSVTVCLNALRLRFFKPKKPMDLPPLAVNKPSDVVVKTASQIENSVPKGKNPGELTEEIEQIEKEAPVEIGSTPMSATKMVLIPKGERVSASVPEKPDLAQTQAIAWLSVEGMTCAHCQAHVKKALEGLENVSLAEVTLDPGQAVVYEQKVIGLSELAGAIEEAGYQTQAFTHALTFELNEGYGSLSTQAWSDELKKLASPGISGMLVDLKKLTIEIASPSGLNGDEIQKRLAQNEPANPNTQSEGGNHMVTLTVEGMSCAHCKARVEKALAAVPGVESVSVDLDSKKATVNGKDLDLKALAHAVTEAGYAVTAFNE